MPRCRRARAAPSPPKPAPMMTTRGLICSMTTTARARGAPGTGLPGNGVDNSGHASSRARCRGTGRSPRGATGVALLVRFAAARGVPPDVALAGTGLDASVLDRTDVEVTADQELRVVRTLRRELGEVAGRGRRRPTASRRSARSGWRCWPVRTVLDAMTTALRFIDLSFAFVIPRADVEGDVVRVTMDAGRCRATCGASCSSATRPPSGWCSTTWSPAASARCSRWGTVGRPWCSVPPSWPGRCRDGGPTGWRWPGRCAATSSTGAGPAPASRPTSGCT